MSVKHQTAIGIAAVCCTLIAAVAFGSARAADDENLLPAATTAGCRVDAPWAAALQAWPGAPDASLQIVATVSGDITPQYDGELCVGLVRAAGADFKKEAGLTGAIIHPPTAGTSPVDHTYVAIDAEPYRFSPSETAFAVRVTEEFNSEPISNSPARPAENNILGDNNSEAGGHYNSTLLYLFRRNGAQLIEIFHAKVEDGVKDKIDIFGGEQAHQKAVKFSKQAHQGAYDLILSPRSGGKSETFIWSGARYTAP